VVKITIFYDDALMMEAVITSETSVNFYQTNVATSQKTVTFIIDALKT
jgi:hypothetical protein